jgi:Glycosyltransferase family 87
VSLARRVLPLLAVTAILVAIVLDYWYRTEPLGIDFHTYEAAARVGLEQGWSHIYDQARVAVEQKALDPVEVAQPFLSPPTVAWLAAALAPLPYQVSFYIWASLTLVAFVGALAWSALSRGPARWILVGAAVAPWWLFEAVHVGQVVPLVAAGMAIAWRLLREDRNVAAGLALSLLLLKPNTAFVVPFALLAAGRYRTFVTFSASGAALAVIALLTLGGDGVSAYLSQLTGPLPPGADALTFEGALGVRGDVATALRVVIIATVLVSAFRLRGSPGQVLVVGILGSLVAVTYLHASDLCLLTVAAWIVWEERPALAWRLPMAAGWLLASPYAVMTKHDPSLNRWPLLELAFLAAMVVLAWQVGRARPRDKVVAGP